MGETGKSSTMSLVTKPPVPNFYSAFAVLFFMLAPWEMSKSSYDNCFRQLPSLPVTSARLKIHLRESWGMRTVSRIRSN